MGRYDDIYAVYVPSGCAMDRGKTCLEESELYQQELDQDARDAEVCDECGELTNNHSRPVHRRGKQLATLCRRCGSDRDIVSRWYRAGTTHQ
ncbi:MAG: hypothetical protein GY788_07465 [bacterium]|nr:hypothetical protein [bacterium]